MRRGRHALVRPDAQGFHGRKNVTDQADLDRQCINTIRFLAVVAVEKARSGHPGTPEVILIGTGSEVHNALEAGRHLAAKGVVVRVVSMPSWELYDQQPADDRESVLPPNVRKRVAVEAGITLGWERYVGLDGAVVGMRSFGASAPGEVLYERFGITADNVIAHARALLKR